MPKGFFSQCFCILLDRNVALAELESKLAAYKIVSRIENPDCPWMFAGPSLVLAYNPDANGYMSVDVVPHKWPDHMGHPEDEQELFAAWATSQFGPFPYPKGLERASQQSWTWEGAESAIANHNAFLRLRMSYSFDVPEDAPVLPENYFAIPELEFMTDVTRDLLTLPAAICYFNPNGEVIRNPAEFNQQLEMARSAGQPALSLWSNIRLYGVDEEWSVMDTVGLGQVDLCDMEVCFLRDRYKPEDMDYFLRDVTLYILDSGAVIYDGNTTNGPGELLMRAHTEDESLVDPPRPVLRWVPEDGAQAPENIVS